MAQNKDSTIISLAVGDSTVSRGDDIANVIYDHFITLPVELKITSSVCNVDFNAYIQINHCSLFFSPITVTEVTNIILKL